MLGNETMHEAATACRQDDGLADEGAMIDEIEQVLERPRHGRTVDRSRNDQQIRTLDDVEHGTRLGPDFIGRQSLEQAWRRIRELDDFSLEVPSQRDRIDERTDKGGRP